MGGMGLLPDMAGSMPLAAAAAGQFMAAFSGAALLFVSYGLERRQSRAFQLAASLLCLGCVGALLYGLSWLTACMSGVVLLAVCLARRRFYRSSFFWEERIPIYWLAGALGVLALAAAVGWALYHPQWNKAALWGLDSPGMAVRVAMNFSAIAVGLAFSWIWRTARRKRARRSLDERV
jgi:hypothetical protein